MFLTILAIFWVLCIVLSYGFTIGMLAQYGDIIYNDQRWEIFLLSLLGPITLWSMFSLFGVELFKKFKL